MSSYPQESPEKARRLRFVTLSQQFLALAVVVAVLTPAARTVTMDVRPVEPVDVVPGDVSLRAAPTEVPTTPVEAEVEQYSLTAAKDKKSSKKDLRSTKRWRTDGGEVVDSDVVPVEGYGTVGVTWAPGSEVSDDAIEVAVRTKTGSAWSDWTAAEYHDEHGPDPRTEEGKKARPGTDALLIGEVDAVQVKVTTEDGAPADMKLAVIDPGKAASTAKEGPAIDTAKLATDADPDSTTEDPAADPVDEPLTGGGTDDLSMQAGSYTPKPKIYSRAQWGADESLRDKPSLSYYEVHAGFVHHTVNANNYTSAQVPGIIRGIYNYHVKTRGWSDIGYNFLVDRFGRIWEGRYGGVDRPVVGAHTQGYNQYSFAMSAIGNYDIAKPSSAMIVAYAQLFAWKLSLHGVRASSTAQKVGSKTFQAINGHRDAGQTACPGKYLYALIPNIRAKAAALQASWAGRELESDMGGAVQPDIVARRISDGRGIVLPIRASGGRYIFGNPVSTGQSFKGLKKIWKVGDWDRDGKVDVMGIRSSDNMLLLYRGLGSGKLAAPRTVKANAGAIPMLAPVGDVTGDGWPDFMGQPKGGVMRIYPGYGSKNFKSSFPAYSAIPSGVHIGVGRWNGDGAPDSMIRTGSKLTIYYGNGPGGWTSSKTLAQTAAGYDWFLGVSSLDSAGHTDILARNATNKNVYSILGTSAGLREPVIVGRMTNYDLAG